MAVILLLFVMYLIIETNVTMSPRREGDRRKPKVGDVVPLTDVAAEK